MKIKEQFKHMVCNFSSKVKKTFNITKLEFKLKNLNKEKNETFTKIGSIVYTYKLNNIENNFDEIENLFKRINEIKLKIKNLEKEILFIKNFKKECKNDEEFRMDYYECIDEQEKKDLKIFKTKDGVEFLKFCPKCNAGNKLEELECISCKNIF